ncbi:MAG: hypothetical protein ABIS12_11845 [Bacteroidia bacterium]
MQTDDEKLTFRVNGIFQYSLALWSYQNEEFRNKLFNEAFLLHPNIWEYYSGLAKSDVDFLRKVVSRVSGIFDPLVKQYIDDIPEDSLLLKVPGSLREEISLAMHGEMETDSISPLANNELDEINEKYLNQLPSELKNSNSYHASNLVTNETDLNAIERAFRIVSRVFRNTDLNQQDEVVLIFDKILVWGMLFGAAMEDELKDTPSDTIPFPGEHEDKEFWKEFVRQYMPLVIQGMIFHHLAQANMERIFELVRDKYAGDVQKKQYKYFISALLVIELNPAEHVAQIKILINSITNSTLRHVLYYKLITYHLVKGHENKNFATNIRPLIMLLAERLWPNGRAMAEAQLRQQEKLAQIKPD